MSPVDPLSPGEGRRAQEWQPIETAPLAQTVLLWARGWRSPFVGQRTGDFGAVYIDGDPGFHMCGATHWMTLPATPPVEGVSPPQEQK